MIVSRLKMEFNETSWTDRAGERVRHVFERAADAGEKSNSVDVPLEHMSLGALLYYALVGGKAAVEN